MPAAANGLLPGHGRILHIEEKGRLKVQFGQGPLLEVDVVAVQSAWGDVDRQFRNEQGIIPPEMAGEANRAMWNFVRQMIVEGSSAEDRATAVQMAERLTLANAMEFLARIMEEGLALQRFFDVKLPAEPSSPESTEVRFST